MTKDRISILPDSLIHYMFSYMDKKQVIQTSQLSRRWRSLWISNPYLNIQLDNGEDDNKLKNFVDRVLLLRDGSNIHKFCLHYPPAKETSDHINVWMQSVLRRNVQEITLKHIQMSYRTLKILLGNVKALTLHSVYVSECHAHHELILSSPTVEILVLENCYYENEILALCTPNVKYMKLKDDMVDQLSSSWCCTKIRAHKLQVLVIEGGTFKDYMLESLPALVTADVKLDRCPVDEVLGSCLTKFLKGISNAKSLTLSATSLQVFPHLTDTFNMTAIQFLNLRYLKLTEWSTTGYICVIRELLKTCPLLETLVLTRSKVVLEPQGAMKGGWAAQLSWPFVRWHLKTIEIQNPEVCDNEFHFLEFLMKKAPHLEMIVMTSTNTLPTYKSELLRFCQRLRGVPKASSSVVVLIK